MKHLTTLLLLFALLLSVLASCQGAAPTATLPAGEKLPQTTTGKVPPASSTKSPAITQVAPVQTQPNQGQSSPEDLRKAGVESFLEGASDSALWVELSTQAENYRLALNYLEPLTYVENGILTIPKEHADLLYVTAYYSSQEYALHDRHYCPIQGYFQKLEQGMKEKEWESIVFEGGRIFYENGGFYFISPKNSSRELWYVADFGRIQSIEISSGCTVKAHAFANTSVLEEVSLCYPVVLDYAAFANCSALKTIRCKSPENFDPKYSPILHFPIQASGSFGTNALSMNYASGGPYEPFTAYSEQEFQTMRQERDKAVPFYPTDDVAEHYVVIDGVLVAYNGIGGHVVIPEGVTEIRGGVFEHCKTNVLEVTLPSTLKKICTGAFAEMPMLIELELPDGLEEIEPLAIYEDINSIPFIHVTNIPENCKVAENAFHDYHPER